MGIYGQPGRSAKDKEVLEIPRSQRYVNRPPLVSLFEENTIRDKGKRNSRIGQAVLKHGYSQSEIARPLGIHYSTISNLLRKNQINRSKT
jgi:putative transposase